MRTEKSGPTVLSSSKDLPRSMSRFWATFVESPTLRIVRASSPVASPQRVLDALRAKSSLDGLVPPCVARYIEKRAIEIVRYVPGNPKYVAAVESKLTCSDPGTHVDFPMKKISARLRDIDAFIRHQRERKRVVVLFNTGSYCPPHAGHAELFSKARTEFEAANKGAYVVGGYAVPSGSQYVDRKMRDKGITSISGFHRLGMTKTITDNHPSIDFFVEASQFEVARSGFCDFDAVGAALRAYLFANKGVFDVVIGQEYTLEVWYVCGSDHVMNTRIAPRGPYITAGGQVWADGIVAVSREGVKPSERLSERYQNNESFLIVTTGATSVSSTEVRERLLKGQSTRGLLPLPVVDYIDHYGITVQPLSAAESPSAAAAGK